MDVETRDHAVAETSVSPLRKSRAGRKPIGDHAMDAVLHVRITRQEQDALKSLAAQSGISIGGLLRTVITDLLARKH
jgi:hypothetical protein